MNRSISDFARKCRKYLLIASLIVLLLLNVIVMSYCGAVSFGMSPESKQQNIIHLEETARLFVSDDNVYVRNQALHDGNVVLYIENAGAEFACIGHQTDAAGNLWYLVRVDAENTGWIPEEYSLKIDYGEENIQAYIDALTQFSSAVGVQTACFEKGQVLWCYCCGDAERDISKMTDDTKIRVASLSKILLAMEAMKMQELGVVDVDENIGRYWNCVLPRNVTLRSLLTHSSTIHHLDYQKTVEDTIAQLVVPENYYDEEIGSAESWRYSNYGVGIAGSTLELAFGTPLEAFGSYQFFQDMDIDASWYSGNYSPAELASLYYDDGKVARSAEAASQISIEIETGHSTGCFAGGLTISARDFAKLMAMLANDGIYDGTRYLTEESVEAMETKHFTVSENDCSFEQCMPLRYKDGLYGEDSLYYHTGNAYGVLALASYNPQTTCGVVVVTTGAPLERDEQGIYLICSRITEFIYISQRTSSK